MGEGTEMHVADRNTATYTTRPFVPGVVVHYTSSGTHDMGIIASITELSTELRGSYYADSYELTCLVRSEDKNRRFIYHSIPGKDITLATEDSLAKAPQTVTVLSFKSLLNTEDILPKQIFGQRALVYLLTYKNPEPYGTLGIPLSPLFLATINHSFTLKYLENLSLKLQDEPDLNSLRDMWRLLTLCDYDTDMEKPDPRDTFTCRTPGVANYSTKGADTLGNFIINEYNHFYNSFNIEFSIGDICEVNSAPQPVRIDRILEMGPNGNNSRAIDQKIYIYGLTYVSDSRSVSDIVPCVYPISLVDKLISTSVESTNFAREFQIDFDAYDLWTLVTADHIQEGNQYIATVDMQTGFNFVSALDVYLSSNDDEITYATPLECSLCKYIYVQGNINHILTGDQVYSWKHGRDGSIVIAGEKTKAKSESEAMPISFSDLRKSYDIEKSVVALDSWLYTEPCTYMYSRVSSRSLNEVLELSTRILERTSAIAVDRGFKCCYCGEILTNKDKIAGPFIYALMRCSTPLFLAQYVPPVLFAAHHSCAFYTPEIVFLKPKNLKSEHCRLLSEERFDLIVTRHSASCQTPIPLIVQATAFDRVIRALLTEFSPHAFFNIRKTFKRNRMELSCSICGKPGALIGCYNNTCQFTAHYPCIVSKGLIIGNNREVYCKRHS